MPAMALALVGRGNNEMVVVRRIHSTRVGETVEVWRQITRTTRTADGNTELLVGIDNDQLSEAVYTRVRFTVQGRGKRGDK
jgi:hypothetical protein